MGLKYRSSLSQAMPGSYTNTNRDSLANIFPPSHQLHQIFEFWLVYWIILIGLLNRFDWFTESSLPFVIGQYDNFGFIFKKQIN